MMDTCSGCESIFKEFQNYRRDGTFCNVVLAIAEIKFSVHKAVLSAASVYFKILFTGEMKEKVQNEISIKGVTELAVSTCLKFIYREQFDITRDGVCDLLHAACLFQLETLKLRCIDAIQNNIEIGNCLEAYHISRMYDCAAVEVESKNMMLKNAEDFLTDEKNLSGLDRETLSMLFKSQSLSVSNESVIFEALVKWIAFDEEERKDYFCEMLELIRLPVMDRRYFTDHVWNNNHIQNECQKCKKYATDCLLYIADKRRRSLQSHQTLKRPPSPVVKKSLTVVTGEISTKNAAPSTSNRSKRRRKKNNPKEESLVQVKVDEKKTPDSEVTVVWGFLDELSIKKFNIDNNSFTDHISKNDAISHSSYDGFCLHKGVVYVIHGPKTCNWSQYGEGEWKNLPETTHQFPSNYSLIGYKDMLLVVGGDNCFVGSTWKVGSFNLTDNEWKPFPSLNEGRTCSACVVLRDCVYVTGGWDDDHDGLSTVECYNPDQNQWNLMPCMKEGRFGHACQVHNDKIFVAGGWGGQRGTTYLSSVETYHLEDNSWTNVRSLNVGRCWFGMFVSNNKLRAFGGRRDAETSLYETFEENLNIWLQSDVKIDEIDYCKILEQ